MKIGLFIPCFMNELYPEVCLSTLKVLENLDIEVEYPQEQTCCGQPMANSGCTKDVKQLAHKFVNTFKKYDYIVAPTGSCVSMVKDNYAEFFEDDIDFTKVKTSIYELTEFLHDIIKVENFDVEFNHKVGIHNSCHGLRELKLASPSELNIDIYSKVKNLLSNVKGLEFTTLSRNDECCGFGGTFCVNEEAVSVAMGKDRVNDHLNAKSEYIVGVDMSCLMHMQGLIDRNNLPLKTIHISQILAGDIK